MMHRALSRNPWPQLPLRNRTGACWRLFQETDEGESRTGGPNSSILRGGLTPVLPQAGLPEG